MPPQLDNLPPEILFNILSFTEPTCNPTLISYPLNALAEANKQLNSVVEEYARGLLKQHANFTPPKSSKIFTCRRKWLAEICQFCKKISKRRAILYPTLTCCRACDKEHFPKMTMTEAIRGYNLSKLDLFTPSILHPRLPQLATGTYSVSGGTATMIAEADVIARRDLICSLLGDKAQDLRCMRNRPAAHTRIIQHMGITWSCSRRHWKTVPELSLPPISSEDKRPKSMRSRENRDDYAKKALRKEWTAMGMSAGGMSQDPAITLDWTFA